MSGSPTNSQRESDDQPGNDFEKLSKADLIRLIKTKEIEVAQLDKALKNLSFDPSIFIAPKVREPFWDRMRVCQEFIGEKRGLETDIQKGVDRFELTKKDKQDKLRQLQKDLTVMKEARADNEALQAKQTDLEEEIRIRDKRIEELHARNHFLNRWNGLLEHKVEEYSTKVELVEKHFKDEQQEYMKERKKLASRVSEMDENNMKGKPLFRICDEFKSSETFYSNTSQSNLDQIVLRFNTVKAESIKFVELLNLVQEFHKLVLKDLDELTSKGALNREDRIERDKVAHLLEQLSSERMCHNYIKGLLSKDITVFKKTIEFLINLGPTFLASKHELFEDDTIVSRLCQDLRAYTNFENKKKVLNLITEMIQHSEKFTKTFVALGGVQILISEFNSYKDPVFVNSEYFCHLLTVLRKMLPNEVEFSDFVNIEILGYFVKLLSECYNKSSLFEILQILNFLGSKPNIRKRLMHLKIFKRVIKFYEDSWRNKDLKLLFYVFLLMGKFTREEGFKLQLISHFEIQNDVSTLFEPFKEENSHLTTEEIKCATLEIIRNLVMQSSPQKMRETLVKSSFLKSAIQVCMNDDSNLLKNLALDCLISTKDFVIKQIMRLDDLVINLEKLYDTKDSTIQSKMLLFVIWGLKNHCLEHSVVKQELIIKVGKGSLLSLESGEAGKFRKEFLMLYLMLEEPNWRETILSIRYFEDLIVTRFAQTVPTVKAWFNSMVLVLESPYLNSIFKSNPNYIKFIWKEITDNIRDYTLEVMLLLRASINLDPFRQKFQESTAKDSTFLALVLSYFVTLEPSPDLSPAMLFVCYEVIHYMCNLSLSKEVMLKNKQFHDCLRRRLKEANDVSKIVVRIVHHLVVNNDKNDVKDLVTRDFVNGLNNVLIRVKEYDLGGFLVEINKNLLEKQLVLKEDLKLDPTAVGQVDSVKSELGSRFKPKLTLCDDIIEGMMDKYKQHYIDASLTE